MLKQLMAFGIALAGTGFLTAQPVFADTTTDGNITTTTDGAKVTSTATTTAKINLTAGDLKIVQAPDIDFGQQKIDANDSTYTAKTVTPNLQVLNAGHDQDWSVSLKVGDFIGSKGRTLKGASMRFVQIDGDDGSTEDKYITTTADNMSGAPDGTGSGMTYAAGGDENGIFAAAQQNSVDGTPVGIGLWTSTYAKVTLDVPAGNVQGDYSSTLTWTLNNAPQ